MAPSGGAWELGPSPGLTAVSPWPQVLSAMRLSWALLLLAAALALEGTAAARCPTPCVCDNLRAHVLCLNGNLMAIPSTIPQVGKGIGRGLGEEEVGMAALG